MIKQIIKRIAPKSYRPLTMFPYPFVGKPYDISCGMDDTGMPWAEYGNDRVYFKTGSSVPDAKFDFWKFLEDEGLTGYGRRKKAPHCYVTEHHRPLPGDVLVDLGCSEGFFARHFADVAKKIILVESDPEWDGPLRKTFADCLDKTTIVPKFAGDGRDGKSVRLCDVLEGLEDETFFVKMDIEGAEVSVLESSADFLRSHKVKLSCCTYHRSSDARVMKAMLRKMGFTTEFSPGWMLPPWAKMFRRGLIYARNFAPRQL